MRTPMELALRHLRHDTVSKETIAEFADVLDEYPVVRVSLRVISQPEETESEIESKIKHHIREVLEAAVLRCK